jgi:hypothetical protein
VRSWRSRLLALTVVVLVALPGVSRASSGSAGPPSAVQVVRGYLGALGRHDARGVCESFSPQLRAFLGRWEPGRDCAKRVAAAHFASDSPGHRVTRIRVIRVGRVALDPYGNLAVHVVLRYRFPCIVDVAAIRGCRPGVERRGDLVYLRQQNGRWLIVKPGEIFGYTSLEGAPAWYDALTPPGDSSTVKRLASLPAPPVACPPGGVSAFHPIGLRFSAEPASLRGAPWLDITKVTAIRVGRQQVCATITLASPPQADSIYSIDLGQAKGGGSVSDAYDLEIDGTGGVQTRLADPRHVYSTGRSPCPTAFGLTGNELELIFSPGDKVFDNARSLGLDASTASLEPGEPLLAHPLQASDVVPYMDGLRLPPIRSSAHLSRCAAM